MQTVGVLLHCLTDDLYIDHIHNGDVRTFTLFTVSVRCVVRTEPSIDMTNTVNGATDGIHIVIVAETKYGGPVSIDSLLDTVNDIVPFVDSVVVNARNGDVHCIGARVPRFGHCGHCGGGVGFGHGFCSVVRLSFIVPFIDSTAARVPRIDRICQLMLHDVVR